MHHELVDGVVRAMAPASPTHGVIQGNLTAILHDHLRRTRPACRVVATPGIVPRVNANENFRIPDLGVTCGPLPPGQLVVREPLLLAEVLSPSSKVDTWVNVWAYCTLPSLQEILVVDSDRIAAHVVRRGSDGHWPELPAALGPEGTVELQSVGLSFFLLEAYEGTHLRP